MSYAYKNNYPGISYTVCSLTFIFSCPKAYILYIMTIYIWTQEIILFMYVRYLNMNTYYVSILKFVKEFLLSIYKNDTSIVLMWTVVFELSLEVTQTFKSLQRETIKVMCCIWLILDYLLHRKWTGEIVMDVFLPQS